MAQVKDIFYFLDNKVPFSIQMSFDNSGFLVGRSASQVRRILIALDITEEVIQEAVQNDCQLIISHHPIIFHPAKSITDDNPVGRRVLALVENQISAICAHTNLDMVSEGVNDALAKQLGLHDVQLLHSEGVDRNGRPYGVGRMGVVTGYDNVTQFAAFVQKALGAKSLRVEDAGRPVHRVAVGGGSCDNLLEEVAALGCDTFVTADIKYDVFLDAKALGINLIDGGHFPTENVVCPVLAAWLKEGFPDLEIFLSMEHQEICRSL